MCLSCGCNKAHDSHGDARNITYETLQAAAKAENTSVDEVIKQITKSAVKDRINHEEEYTAEIA